MPDAGAATSQTSAFAHFTNAAKPRPFGAAAGLVVEYLMFASAVFLALLLFATRVPLRLIDGAFGLRLRERCVDLLARISPG
jgi:hypothetical protein